MQYFGKVRHNSVAPDDFIEFVSVTNHIRLWDAELLAWYPPRALQIWLHSLEHSLGINAFRSTWSCLIVEILAIRTVKFLQPWGYSIWINWTFTFCTRNVFGCIRDVMTQLELIKHVTELDHEGFKSHARGEAMNSMLVHQLPRYYQPQPIQLGQ